MARDEELQRTAGYLRTVELGTRLVMILAHGAQGIEVAAGPEADGIEPLRTRVSDSQADDTVEMMGWVDPTGDLVFAGYDCTGVHLGWLVSLVRSESQHHPGLRALVGARLIRLGEQDQVVATLADPEGWEGLAVAPLPGSLQAAVRELGRLVPERPVGLWATRQTHLGAAHLCLQEDPSGLARFAALLRADPADEIRGLLRIMETGDYVVLVEGSAPEARATLDGVFDGLERWPALLPLKTARVARLRDGRLTDYELPVPLDPPSPKDLDRSCAALEAATPGEALSMWFTLAGPTGSPELVVAPDPERVVSRVRTLQAGTHALGATLTARIVFGEGLGRVVTSRDPGTLWAPLVRFVSLYSDQRPALQRLDLRSPLTQS